VRADIERLARLPAAALLEIETDEGDMLGIVGLQPELGRLGREAAIGECDEELPTGAQDAADFGEDFGGVQEVLDADRAERYIE